VATAPGGTVCVADSGHHRLLKFAPDGKQTTVSFGVLVPAMETLSGLVSDGAGDLCAPPSCRAGRVEAIAKLPWHERL
jgi:NHL repeat